MKRLWLILIFTAMLWGCGQKETASPGGKGSFGLSELPGIVLKDLDGIEHDLLDYKGKILIVNFWATWCGPCKKEIPDFIQLKDEYGERGLEIIGISLDDSLRDAREYSRANKINYPVLYKDKEMHVVELFGGLKGIPTSFIIGRDGKVVAKFIGLRDKETFEQVLLQYL